MAEWLDSDPRVSYVLWAGLPSHPHHERAQKYLPLGPGSVFAFGLQVPENSGVLLDGREAGRLFIESLQLASHLANVGDARTLVIHPASTTHLQLGEAQLAAVGLRDDMIRLSVGLEHAGDIVADLDRALRAGQKP